MCEEYVILFVYMYIVVIIFLGLETPPQTPGAFKRNFVRDIFSELAEHPFAVLFGSFMSIPVMAISIGILFPHLFINN